MIVLRNHPAVKSVLNLITLNRGARVKVDHEMNQRIKAASMAIFRITAADTAMEYPAWMPEENWEHWPAAMQDRFTAYCEEWERPSSEYWDMEPRERISFLRTSGWDVCDGNGDPLECLPSFLPQILHVIAGRRGKPVDQIDADTWAAAMTAPAPSLPSPAQAGLNRKLLALATPRPRAANDRGRPRPTRPTRRAS